MLNHTEKLQRTLTPNTQSKYARERPFAIGAPYRTSNNSYDCWQSLHYLAEFSKFAAEYRDNALHRFPATGRAWDTGCFQSIDDTTCPTEWAHSRPEVSMSASGHPAEG
jgi:hypothetical protein